MVMQTLLKAKYRAELREMRREMLLTALDGDDLDRRVYYAARRCAKNPKTSDTELWSGYCRLCRCAAKWQSDPLIEQANRDAEQRNA